MTIASTVLGMLTLIFFRADADARAAYLTVEGIDFTAIKKASDSEDAFLFVPAEFIL